MLALEPNAPLLLCLLAWGPLAVALVLQRLRGTRAAARRGRLSLAGLGLQSVAFFVVFAIGRGSPAALAPRGPVLRWTGVALAWAGTALVIAAMLALGRHWSLEARLLPGHRLVREGPYAHVRHPIYAAMLGLMLGTGLNLTAWPAMGTAVLLYLAGTRLRIGVEDGLLRQQFGDEFACYAAEVPALWPGRSHRASAAARRAG